MQQRAVEVEDHAAVCFLIHRVLVLLCKIACTVSRSAGVSTESVYPQMGRNRIVFPYSRKRSKIHALDLFQNARSALAEEIERFPRIKPDTHKISGKVCQASPCGMELAHGKCKSPVPSGRQTTFMLDGSAVSASFGISAMALMRKWTLYMFF